MSNKTSGVGGIGFGGLLTILFIALKLCGVIDWSWWWVLAPTWIMLSISLFFLGIAGMFLLLAKVLESRMSPQEKVAHERRKRFGR